MLRAKVALKRWYENDPAETPPLDSARSTRSRRKTPSPGWFSWNPDMVGAPLTRELMRWNCNDEPPWRHPAIKVRHPDTGIVPYPCLDLNDGTHKSSGHVLVHEGANVFDPHRSGSLQFDPLHLLGNAGHGLRTLSVLCGYHQGRFAGVTPRANVIPFRVTNFVVINHLLKNDRGLMDGIRRAVIDKGCLVLSMSLGNPGFPGAPTGQMVDLAYEMGVIMVATAGNITSEVTFPGRYARTIAVGGASN